MNKTWTTVVLLLFALAGCGGQPSATEDAGTPAAVSSEDHPFLGKWAPRRGDEGLTAARLAAQGQGLHWPETETSG